MTNTIKWKATIITKKISFWFLDTTIWDVEKFQINTFEDLQSVMKYFDWFENINSEFQKLLDVNVDKSGNWYIVRVNTREFGKEYREKKHYKELHLEFTSNIQDDIIKKIKNKTFFLKSFYEYIPNLQNETDVLQDTIGWKKIFHTFAELKAYVRDPQNSLANIAFPKVTELCNLFKKCNRVDYSWIETWDVNHITNFADMFVDSKFNGKGIENWNVSNAKDMSGMFCGCKKFNANISGWDVNNVTDMYSMFDGCSSFNIDLGKWNVGNVTDMNRMFHNCGTFDQDLSGWNVKKVQTMYKMFFWCESMNIKKYIQNGYLFDWQVRNDLNYEDMFLYNDDIEDVEIKNHRLVIILGYHLRDNDDITTNKNDNTVVEGTVKVSKEVFADGNIVKKWDIVMMRFPSEKQADDFVKMFKM